MANGVYDLITKKIIAKLNTNVVPWQAPFFINPPKNIISQKTYRGINLLLLADHPYPTNYWITYNQAIKLGGHVRQGEKGSIIAFYKTLEVKQEDETLNLPYLRYYKVFNIAQCNDITAPKETPKQDPIQAGEELINNMPQKPVIDFTSEVPYYDNEQDIVKVPHRDNCKSAQGYYAVLFHELAHATGHPKRLNRNKGERFADKAYSFEELVAEITAGFLCGVTGIANDSLTKNTAAYCKAWMQVLKQDPKIIIKAASQAQKAADFIQGII
jgi:antirestriction protein ArdC